MTTHQTIEERFDKLEKNINTFIKLGFSALGLIVVLQCGATLYILESQKEYMKNQIELSNSAGSLQKDFGTC